MKTENMANLGYMVSVHGGTAPEVTHATQQAAIDEARRLAIKTRRKTTVLAILIEINPAIALNYVLAPGAGLIDGAMEIIQEPAP